MAEGGKNVKINDKSFMELNEAIWKQALKDDFKQQKGRLLMETSEKLFPVLLKYSNIKRHSITAISKIINSYKNESEIRTFHKYEKELDKSFKLLFAALQKKIYRESEKWPGNTKRKDKEYEKQYTEIKHNLINAVKGDKSAERSA